MPSIPDMEGIWLFKSVKLSLRQSTESVFKNPTMKKKMFQRTEASCFLKTGFEKSDFYSFIHFVSCAHQLQRTKRERERQSFFDYRDITEVATSN